MLGWGFFALSVAAFVVVWACCKAGGDADDRIMKEDGCDFCGTDCGQC